MDEKVLLSRLRAMVSNLGGPTYGTADELTAYLVDHGEWAGFAAKYDLWLINGTIYDLRELTRALISGRITYRDTPVGYPPLQ